MQLLACCIASSCWACLAVSICLLLADKSRAEPSSPSFPLCSVETAGLTSPSVSNSSQPLAHSPIPLSCSRVSSLRASKAHWSGPVVSKAAAHHLLHDGRHHHRSDLHHGQPDWLCLCTHSVVVQARDELLLLFPTSFSPLPHRIGKTVVTARPWPAGLGVVWHQLGRPSLGWAKGVGPWAELVKKRNIFFHNVYLCKVLYLVNSIEK
jgi:hypothetical protein